MNLQVKVIAENDEALQQALKEVEVYFGQSVCCLNFVHVHYLKLIILLQHSLYSNVTAVFMALCYVHPEGVENCLQLKLQPCFEEEKQQFTVEHADKARITSLVSF